MSDNFNEFIDKIVEESRKDIHLPYKYLNYQLTLIEKVKRDADKERDDITKDEIPEWTRYYYNYALINIISSFEYFFRELVLKEKIFDFAKRKKYYNIEKGQYTYNFQRYDRIRDFLKNEFKIDIETKLELLDIEWLRLLIIERHLLIHNGGIIDKEFMDLLPSLSKLKVSGYSIGRRLWIESNHIDIAIKIVREIGNIVEEYLKTLDR